MSCLYLLESIFKKTLYPMNLHDLCWQHVYWYRKIACMSHAFGTMYSKTNALGKHLFFFDQWYCEHLEKVTGSTRSKVDKTFFLSYIQVTFKILMTKITKNMKQLRVRMLFWCYKISLSTSSVFKRWRSFRKCTFKRIFQRVACWWLTWPS